MPSDCIEDTLKLKDRLIHAYFWRDGKQAAKSVPEKIVLLFHGLMMHGKTYNRLARHIAADNSLVVAPDIRGFGRWYYCSQDSKNRIDYQKSLDDAIAILEHLKQTYPQAPRFCIGESLGAHLARRITSIRPDLVDGLILSSPCLRPRMISLPLVPHALSEFVYSGLDPSRQINLTPFARKFLQHEPENLESYLEDPLSRKSLAVLELIDSVRVTGLLAPEAIPSKKPVLVLRGKNDCVCKHDSFSGFVASMKSDNLTIHPCVGCGHLILQGKELNAKILKVLDDWLKDVSCQYQKNRQD
ncbi:MAG: lysophospholipase [Candidatus Obscuribacterales bacterium]|nr:lysophospholipase [Candidatus Obscuribacterales bacterium]